MIKNFINCRHKECQNKEKKNEEPELAEEDLEFYDPSASLATFSDGSVDLPSKREFKMLGWTICTATPVVDASCGQITRITLWD